MSKKVLLISASPRIRGNSDSLCDEFMRGVMDSGSHAEKVRLHQKNYKGCLGCGVCKINDGKCVQNDDIKELLDKMLEADVIVLATPIYFYSMDGQLKLFIDRTYPMYPQLKGKDFYFILTGGAPSEEYMSIAIEGLRGYLKCIPDANEKGIVYGVNAGNKGDVLNSSAMQTAYKFGMNV